MKVLLFRQLVCCYQRHGEHITIKTGELSRYSSDIPMLHYQVLLEWANFRLSLDMCAPIPVLEQVLYHVFDFDSFIRRIVSSYNFRIPLDKSFPIW